MSFYFVAYIQKVLDPAGLQEYARLALQTVKQSRGVRLAAGLSHAEAVKFVNATNQTDPVTLCERLEGDAIAGMSLLKFPDRAAFEEWYYSEEYQKAVRIREAAAVTQIVLVEGT